MIDRKNKNSLIDFNLAVPYVSFPELTGISFLRHGFSTRLGGVSTGMFSSMNLGLESGPYHDDTTNIKENYQRIAGSIGFDPSNIVVSHQVHKTNIRLVDENDRGKGLFKSRDYEEIDGLITNTPDIILVTKFADCVPLYIVDPVNKAIGLSHSGWRGTVKKIGKITIEEMQRCFQSKPENLITVIGPSICTDCYEIGVEVAEEFRIAFSDKANTILYIQDNDKYLCSLWEANKAVFLEAGIQPENIFISGLCTCCNNDIFFSHRRTGWERGSLAAFLGIVEE